MLDTSQFPTVESHPFAVEILNTNFVAVNTIRCKSEDRAHTVAEEKLYLLGRETKSGSLICSIAVKKYEVSNWVTISEFEF
jgi:hypothetical protein